MRRIAPIVLLLLLWVPAAGAWTWPVYGPVLQGFAFDPAHPYAGGQHRGIDVGADAAGVQVVAPAGGVVTFAGTVPSSGKSLTIETPDGLAVTLTHLGSVSVAKGAAVAEGTVVGTVGPSGTPEVDGPYLHVGIRTAADPEGYLDPLAFLPVMAAPVAAPAPAPAAPPDVAAPPVAADPPAAAPPVDQAPPATDPAPAAAQPAPEAPSASDAAPAADAPAAQPSPVAPSEPAAPPAAPAAETMPAAEPPPAQPQPAAAPPEPVAVPPAPAPAVAPAAALDAPAAQVGHAPAEPAASVEPAVAPASPAPGPAAAPVAPRPQVEAPAAAPRAPAAASVRVDAPAPVARGGHRRPVPALTGAARPELQAAPSIVRVPHVTAPPAAVRRRPHAHLSAFVLGLLALAVAAVLGAARMISSRSPSPEGTNADAVAPEDPRRTRVAVCERAEAHRSRGRVRRAGGRLRALPAAAGERRPDGERDGRARHAGDGRGRPERRLAA